MLRIEEYEAHGYGVDTPGLDKVGHVVAVRHFLHLAVWI